MRPLLIQSLHLIAAPVLLVAFSVIESEAGSFRFRAGIGYEFVSQEFFLDSIVARDSLTPATALNTTYLDDYKGLIGVVYRSSKYGRLELGSSIEQTPELLRLKLYGRGNSQFGSNRLSWNAGFDRRDRYKNAEEVGDSYYSGSGLLRLTLPLSRSMSLKPRVKGGFLRFDSTGNFSQNQFYGGSRIGLSFRLPGYSFLEGSLYMDGRSVPDSTLLNYISFGSDWTYFGLFGHGDMDLRGRLERRDYNSFESQDDYVRLELDFRHNWKLGGGWLSRQILAAEAVRFDDATTLNFNYTRVSLEMLLGLELNGFTLATGPRLEYLDEGSAGFSQGEDYSELGIKLDLDYINLGGVFFSAELTTGRRKLADEGELQSSFFFQRILFLEDLRILGNLHLNSLISAEWEWHDQSSENNQILLFSAGITQQF